MGAAGERRRVGRGGDVDRGVVAPGSDDGQRQRRFGVGDGDAGALPRRGEAGVCRRQRDPKGVARPEPSLEPDQLPLDPLCLAGCALDGDRRDLVVDERLLAVGDVVHLLEEERAAADGGH